MKPWDFPKFDLDIKLDLINYADIKSADEVDLQIKLTQLGAIE